MPRSNRFVTVNREFESCRTHFLCEKKRKKKKEEASPQGKNRAMWGEEAKPLKHKNDAESSLTSDKNKRDRSCWKVPGVHTLLMSEGDERF